ncbi:MAG TPA: hypothetical protein VGC10_09130 [Sphingomonas sp.]
MRKSRTIVRLVLLLALLAAAPPPPSIDLPGNRLFPESLSTAPGGMVYVGSISGGVVRVSTKRGRARPWLLPGADGTGSIYGVLADAAHDRLWLCANAPRSPLVIPGARDGSWLVGVGLRSGRSMVTARLPGEKTLCNDIAVGPDGSVYVTNMAAPQILRLRPGATELELWATDPRFQPEHGGGLDGIAFGADGALYVTIFTKGELYRIAVENGRAGAVMPLMPSRPLVRPDALRPLGDGRFVMVEGGGRVDRLAIDGDKAMVETLKDGLAGPTGADVGGGRIWFVEGRLAEMRDPAGPPLPFTLQSLILEPAQ